MTRYYERESYKSVNQLKKHRVEKILLIIITVICMGANIAYLVMKINADSLPSNALNISLSNKILNEQAFIFLQEVASYIRLLDVFLSQLGIAIVLLIYFVALLVQKRKVPIHSVVKVLFCYIALKVSPSPTLLGDIDIDGTSTKMEYVMWSLAVFPFLSLVPAIPFVCLRTPKDNMQSAVGFLGSYLELVLKSLSQPDKIYRLLSTLSSLLGTCAFVVILLSIAMPWYTVRFRPNEDIRPAIDTVGHFISKVDNILNKFKDVTDTVCKGTSRTLNEDVEKAMKKIDEAKAEEKDLKAINEAKKNLSDIQSSVPKSCSVIGHLEKISCGVYIAAYIASIVLMVIPFAGVAGKIALQAARVARKIFLLLKHFLRLIREIDKIRLYLNKMLRTVLKDPFSEWTVTFKPEIHMLLFLFPCLITGLFFISVGFWRRKKSSEVKLRLIVSTISFVFLFTNSALCAYVWISLWVKEATFENLPIIDVEVDELTGWKMVKLAYLFSSASSLLLWTYSSGKSLRIITSIVSYNGDYMFLSLRENVSSDITLRLSILKSCKTCLEKSRISLILRPSIAMIKRSIDSGYIFCSG